MAFNWDDYPTQDAPSSGFNWEDHPEAQPPSPDAGGSGLADTMGSVAEGVLGAPAALGMKAAVSAYKDPSQIPAFIGHFGNRAAQGYLPQIRATIDPHIQNLINSDAPTLQRVKSALTLGLPDHMVEEFMHNIVSPDKGYVDRRDQAAQELKTQQEQHPEAATWGDIGGTVAGAAAATEALPGLALKTAPGAGLLARGGMALARTAQAGTQAAALNAVANPGDTQGVVDPIQAQQRLQNAKTGFKVGAATHGLLGEVIPGAAQTVADMRAPLTRMAIGATGKEAASFVPGTEQHLLDKGYVEFGDSPGDIATKTNRAIDAADDRVTENLGTNLPGTNVNQQTVLDYIQNKINALKSNPGEANLVRELEARKVDIQNTLPSDSADMNLENAADSAPGEVPIAEGNKIKRSFQKQSNYANPNADEADKFVASQYRKVVQDTADAADPEIGQQIAADNAEQHMLIPVRNSAARRAGVLTQNPVGGLNDMVAAGVGGVPGVVARRTLGPRIASMGAVTADRLSKVLASTPAAFGKFSTVLQNAAARGDVSLGATDYILQQTNPEYRAQKNQVFSSTQEDESK